MRLLLTLLFTLTASLAHADSSTYTARLDGTANCQAITLSVTQQVTPGGTTTQLYYQLKECAPGESTPSVVVAQGNAAIPTSAYQTPNRQSHSLRVSTPVGAVGRTGTIDLVWRATTQLQNTFSGTWTEQQGNVTTRTVENQFHTSAEVSGTVVGWTAGGRQGSFSTLVQTGK